MRSVRGGRHRPQSRRGDESYNTRPMPAISCETVVSRQSILQLAPNTLQHFPTSGTRPAIPYGTTLSHYVTAHTTILPFTRLPMRTSERGATALVTQRGRISHLMHICIGYKRYHRTHPDSPFQLPPASQRGGRGKTFAAIFVPVLLRVLMFALVLFHSLRPTTTPVCQVFVVGPVLIRALFSRVLQFRALLVRQG